MGIEIGDERTRKIPGHYAYFVESCGVKRKQEHKTRALAQNWIDRLNNKRKAKGKEEYEGKITRKYVKACNYKYYPIYFDF